MGELGGLMIEGGWVRVDGAGGGCYLPYCAIVAGKYKMLQKIFVTPRLLTFFPLSCFIPPRVLTVALVLPPATFLCLARQREYARTRSGRREDNCTTAVFLKYASLQISLVCVSVRLRQIL